MHFDFNEQQREFREVFHVLLEREYPQGVAASAGAGATAAAQLWHQLAERGLFAILVPPEHDGLGLSFVDLALIIEELGRALVPLSIIDTLVATDLIVRFGSQSQKQRLLPAIAAGRKRISIAAAESAAYGFGQTLSTTMSAGTEGWTASGTKILVPEADTADVLLLLGQTDHAAEVGIGIVEPRRKGVSLREHTTLDLTCRFHEVQLERVVLGSEELLGGMPMAGAGARLFDVASTAAALLMIGIATKVLETSVEYAKTRVQFNKPIGAFQAIKHRCADMAVSTEAGRTAAYYAAWAVAEDVADRTRASSIAKSFSGDAARFVCNEGIQIHGGMGFTWELGLHYFLRRAKLLEYSWGDAAYHRERVLANTLAHMDAEN